MAKVLILGSGAREHALAWKLQQSELVTTVFVFPGNAAPFPKPDGISLSDVKSIISFCKREGISLVVIGPEDLLYNGFVDEISLHLPCFGPTKEASRLEWSKSFAKMFMQTSDIPTPDYQAFTTVDDALEFIENIGWDGIVVKASGLAAGKGVVVAKTREEAAEAVKEMLHGKFGEASSEIVVEEMLVGEEVSALCFTDGNTLISMPLVQDHKRLLDGDRGPNTGGMGVIAPIKHFSPAIYDQIHNICRKTIGALNDRGISYKGILYAGLMITEKKVYVLEYNCRFGDPETEVLMRLLESDLYEILHACCCQQLHLLKVHFSHYYVCGVVLSAEGYPAQVKKGDHITGIPEDNERTVTFHAGTKTEDEKVLTNGGRVLCVTSTGSSLDEARQYAYAAVEQIHFDGAYYRSDIGRKKADIRTMKYEDSGVSIDEGNRLVEKIKSICMMTKIPATDYIGGFGSVVDLSKAGLGTSQLVIGMDGVGTKIAVADEMGRYNTLGDDLVAMCVNDVLCHCAQPVAFLDYYVAGRLCAEKAANIVASIADACKKAGCALVGGETAEMPDVYRKDQWDLAGVCVAARQPEWPLLPMKNRVSEGDVLIGLRSSGLHSNGFSLVRKIFEANRLKYTDICAWNKENTYGDELLRGTRIYVKSVLPLLRSGMVLGAAHITGGGLKENVNRILPDNMKAVIDCASWKIPEVFQWLKCAGPVAATEMLRTFNCGVGMVLLVPKEETYAAVKKLREHTESPFIMGKVFPRSSEEDQVEFVHVKESFLNSYRFVAGKKANVAILISGTGTNMEKLIESSLKADSYCDIVLVVSNRADAKGLLTAKRMGILTKVVPSKGAKNREDYEEIITKELEKLDVQLICLAGFMRILSASFCKRWAGRVINIHPALLPSFKGANAVPLALEHKVKLTGCTVHFVTEEVDSGEIVAQAAVPVLDGDDEESLHERIKAKEHEIYPEAMQMIAKKFVENAAVSDG